MEAFLNIKYKDVLASDNYEDFLKHVGVSALIRKVLLSVHPICILTKEGDVYIITLSTPMKTLKTTFKLNEPFEETRVDGVKVKSVITVEGNKMTHVQTTAAGKKETHVREFFPDKMIVTTTTDGFNGVLTRLLEKTH